MKLTDKVRKAIVGEVIEHWNEFKTTVQEDLNTFKRERGMTC